MFKAHIVICRSFQLEDLLLLLYVEYVMNRFKSRTILVFLLVAKIVSTLQPSVYVYMMMVFTFDWTLSGEASVKRTAQQYYLYEGVYYSRFHLFSFSYRILWRWYGMMMMMVTIVRPSTISENWLLWKQQWWTIICAESNIWEFYGIKLWFCVSSPC